MKRPRPGIATELIPVLLILGCVAGSFGLVLAMQKAAATSRKPERARPSALVAVVPPDFPEPPKPPPPPPVVVVAPPAPSPPVEDPTKKALGTIAVAEAQERAAARDADRRAEALEKARRAAESESRRRMRRESLVRAQLEGLTDKAEALEREAEALALERDALARERDASKAELTKALASGGGYAVLPHRGPNGTWQRPVIIECRDGRAILQPRGLNFSMLDMSALMGVRSSPLVGAVAREMIRVQEVTSPDGAPVVPYIYFIVRPDGIRPFYEARARLEPLGIAFGYELVDQDWEIVFPDVDARDVGGPSKPGGSGGPRPSGEFAWPSDRPGASSGDPQNSFLWPRQQPGEGEGRGDLDRGRLSRLSGGSAGRGLAGRGAPGIGRLNRPGGEGGGVSGPVATESEGVDVTPFLNSMGGLGPRRSAALAPKIGGGDGVTTESGSFTGQGRPPIELPTLSPVSPDGLPGFDPASAVRPGRSGAPGAGWADAPATASGRSPVGVPGDLSRFAGLPPSVLQLLAERGLVSSDSSRTSTPKDGRVRIDPELLARAQDDDEDRPPVPPLGLRLQGPSAESAHDETGRSGPGGSGSSSGIRASGSSPAGATSGLPSPLGMPGSGTAGAPGGHGQKHQQADSKTTQPLHIEVPLELVVVCEPEGVVLHPGGYWLSLPTLKKEKGLKADLETIVRNHALIDPTIKPRPRIQFLVEPGGDASYLEARKQTVLSGSNWPVAIQAVAAPALRVFPKERF